MLKASVPTEDDYRSFLRPVVFDSIKAVLKFYGLDGTAEIVYNGENEISKLIGSNANDNGRTNTYTEGNYFNKLYIVPEFTPSEFDNSNNSRREYTERPVWFCEKDVKVGLYPAFTGLRVDVSVTGIFNSIKTAEQMVRRLKRQLASQVADMSFSPTVNMIVNPGILELFHDVHVLLKKNKPDTPDFWDWFAENRCAPFTKITNVADRHARLTVPRRFNNIGIQFQEPVLSRAAKNATIGRYEVEIRYFFHFSEFPNWEIAYPLNVYQDQIPDKWIPAPQEEHNRIYSIVSNYETAFASQIADVRRVSMPYMFRLPKHDPWTMKKVPWLQPALQARLGLKNLPTQRLGNVFELPDYIWNERAKKYILRRGDKCLNHHSSPFFIQVFSGDIPILPEQLGMEPDGNLFIKRQPYLVNTHRIVVCIDYAIRDYTDEFWEDLKQNPDDHGILPDIFNWYDWGKLPLPWTDHIDDIRKEIDKGTGLPPPTYNIYQTELSLIAYNARSL